MKAITHNLCIFLAIVPTLFAPVVLGEVRVIAVLTTRDSETTALISALGAENVETITLAGREMLIFQKSTVRLAIARCGAGIVNAVITAQAIMDHFQPELLVSIGLCAALDDEIAIGDLLLAESFDRHDIGSHTDAGFLHGTAWNRPTRIDAQSLFADPAAWNLVVQTAQGRMNTSARLVCLVSGDSFIRSSYRRSWMRNKLGAEAVDMSGAAIAAAAEANGLPLFVLRQVSDNADFHAGRQFGEAASDEAVRLAEGSSALIRAWLDHREELP